MNNSQCLSLSLFVPLVASACGGGPVKPPTATPVAASTVAVGTYPVTDLPGVTLCYVGPTSVELATGTPIMSRALSRRAWDAATSTVREDTATWTANNGPVTRTVAEYKLEGPTAKFTSSWQSSDQKSGTQGVTITFTGEPGQWTAWSTEHDMEGTILKMKNTIGADKSVASEGGLFDDKGKQLAQINASLAALDVGPCKDEFSKVPPIK